MEENGHAERTKRPWRHRQDDEESSGNAGENAGDAGSWRPSRSKAPRAPAWSRRRLAPRARSCASTSTIALLGDASDEARSVLQDLIAAAVADAQEKAQERAQQEMAELTEGLPLPPGFTPPV